MRTWTRWARAVAVAVPAIGWALGPSMAHAQQPTVKDLLGKAQTQSETKAVEDLINKLERRQPSTAKPAPPPATSSTPAPAASEQPPVQQPAPKIAPSEAAATQVVPPKASSTEPQPSTPQARAEPPKAAPEPAPAVTNPPNAPEASTDATQQMPSIELEVVFDYKSARLTPGAMATLTPLGRALTDPRLADDFFLIAGHTDAKGSADYNVRLSQQRADSVRQFLIKQFKLEPQRLVARGFGHRRLKDPQNPFDEKNRRVQVINFTPPRAQ